MGVRIIRLSDYGVNLVGIGAPPFFFFFGLRCIVFAFRKT